MALEDAARVMQSIFNDVDLVGSDLVAGLILLNRDQKRKIYNNECLVSDCKKVSVGVNSFTLLWLMSTADNLLFVESVGI